MDLSAVCEYQLEEIQRVFEGPYKEYREQSQKWILYTDPVPSPRPGSVSPLRRTLLASASAPFQPADSSFPALPSSASTTGTVAMAIPVLWSCLTIPSTSSRSTH